MKNDEDDLDWNIKWDSEWLESIRTDSSWHNRCAEAMNNEIKQAIIGASRGQFSVFCTLKSAFPKFLT